MARFHMGEENNFGNTNNQTTSFFSLKEDGETRKVRFMYASANDVGGYSVHEVMVNGKKRYVNCLRDYNSPIDDCPLCKAGLPQSAKLYIPLYEVDTGKVVLWERGKKFFTRMSGLCARFSNLASHIFEIERHGAKGSTETTYDIWEVGSDDTTLADLPEIPSVLGGVLLDKNAEEMNSYLSTGSFGNAVPQRQSQSNQQPSPVPQRRVPTSGKEVF